MGPAATFASGLLVGLISLTDLVLAVEDSVPGQSALGRELVSTLREICQSDQFATVLNAVRRSSPRAIALHLSYQPAPNVRMKFAAR